MWNERAEVKILADSEQDQRRIGVMMWSLSTVLNRAILVECRPSQTKVLLHLSK